MSTKTLNIIQEPCPVRFFCLQESLTALTMDYECVFPYNGNEFQTMRQALIYAQRENTNIVKQNLIEKHASLIDIMFTKSGYSLHKISKDLPISVKWITNRFKVLKDIAHQRTSYLDLYGLLLASSQSKEIINADAMDRIFGVGQDYRFMRWLSNKKNEIGRSYLGCIYMELCVEQGI